MATQVWNFPTSAFGFGVMPSITMAPCSLTLLPVHDPPGLPSKGTIIMDSLLAVGLAPGNGKVGEEEGNWV